MPRQTKEQGIRIEDVLPGSPAFKAGVSPGDVLLSVNGRRLSDIIDYYFYKGERYPPEFVFRQSGRLALDVPEGEDAGLAPCHFNVKKCTNRCVFCFVSQLPPGLRKSLYVKDEDYRMSFLYGNYITMTNLTDKDKRRIAAQRLSPLYISVHSTERKLRNHLLGNPNAPDIMKELRLFRDNRLRAHAQIVLCPGLNDGEHLEKTIRDLYGFYPYVSSVAVVPVGLTAHRKKAMRPVGEKEAAEAIEAIGRLQRRFRKKHGDAIIYAADELYIKAGAELPPLEDYGELPQIENGVGMTALFLSGAKRLRIAAPQRRKARYLTFTGRSFYPYLKTFVERLKARGHDITLVPVENRFFGLSVTVTGLITGRDVMGALSEHALAHDILLIPDAATREGGDVFLDDVSAADLEAGLGLKTRIIESTPRGLINALEGK